MNIEQIERLERLYNLKEKGALTLDEFEREKALLLIDSDNQKNTTDFPNILHNQDYKEIIIPPQHNKTKASPVSHSLWFYFITCMTSKYSCFTGRASIKEYWGTFIYMLLLGIIAFITILTLCRRHILPSVFFDFFPVLIVWFFVPLLALKVRRFHDINLSGWWLLLAILPGVAFLIFIINGFWFGNNKANKYGDIPD